MSQENFNAFKIDQEVQTYKDGQVEDCQIVSLVPAVSVQPKNYWDLPREEWYKDDYYAHAVVRYNDGTEKTIKVDDLDVRDSELEREFRNKVPLIMPLIDAKLAEASKALSEAELIAEEHGIPFSSSVSFLGQGYRPESFDAKYGEVSRDIVTALTDAHNEYAGWEHSAVCY